MASGRKKWRCRICGMYFKTKAEREHHYNLHALVPASGARAKQPRTYRVRHPWGAYKYVFDVSAKNKEQAYREAIREYMKSHRATAAEAKRVIKRSNIKFWRRADGSAPAWRK